VKLLQTAGAHSLGRWQQAEKKEDSVYYDKKRNMKNRK